MTIDSQTFTQFITGTGLVTGQESTVTLSVGRPRQGIRFIVNGVIIPAHPASVIDSGRGVTLGVMNSGQMQPLYIVEHFLAACSMRGVVDLDVTIDGAPELPLLDGSAQDWLPLLTGFPNVLDLPPMVIRSPFSYQDDKQPNIHINVAPCERLEITYYVDFQHPDLRQSSWTWTPDDGPLETVIAPAQTFGFVSELPLLQAQGLAKGVTEHNTLGLTEAGGYTRPLRFKGEPLRHKILDFIGDLMLCGLPATRLRGKFSVTWGGHTAHLAFGKQLAQFFNPIL